MTEHTDDYEEPEWTLDLAPDEVQDLADGVELLIEIDGAFIAENPTIAIRQTEFDD